MSSILESVENKNVDLEKADYYAVIIGESPSKGAKSPSLWNQAFDGLGISGMMHPLDVKPENLMQVVDHLRSDRRFIGGAVTMPYKISIIPYLDGLEPEVEMIGAVNCIYRDGVRLIGANTDGAGALWSLKKAMAGDLAGKTALLLGTGGAGFAVASYLATAFGSGGCLKLANRSPQSREKLARKLQKKCLVEQVDWPVSPGDVGELDILVNCTSIGFETLKEDSKGLFTLRPYTPFGQLDDSIRVPHSKAADRVYFKKASNAIKANLGQSLDILASMKDPLIFDIIYQPRQSVLLSLAGLAGYKTLNGVPMNLEQAVIGFIKAVSASGWGDLKNSDVRALMQRVW